MPHLIDETDNVYGKWTVLTRGPNLYTNITAWWCQCACGAVELVAGTSFRHGLSTQCTGCAYKQLSVLMKDTHAEQRLKVA